MAIRLGIFLDSSAVEQSTVNRSVAGSNPARGAILSPFSVDLPQLRALILLNPLCDVFRKSG
jgi:hypothetical protein